MTQNDEQQRDSTPGSIPLEQRLRGQHADPGEPLSPPPPPPPPAAFFSSDLPGPAAADPGAAKTAEDVPPLPPSPPSTPHSLLPPSELPYPVRYEVAYPERLSRWKTFFRLPLLFPIYVFAYLIQGVLFALFSVGWTTVFWRKKYPSWAFAGGAGAMGWAARATAYGLLQTDKFPSFDYERPDVVLEFADPPSGQLSRWRVFWWKLALLLPHYVVLQFLQTALMVVTVLAWFGIMFTGNYPRGMFAFATGVMRWQYRVVAYFASYNDRYPPFALSRDAGPAGNKAVVWSGVAGIALFGGFVLLIVIGILTSSGAETQRVDFDDLKRGVGSDTVIFKQTDGGTVLIRLNKAIDPADDRALLLDPRGDERVVIFEWVVRNRSIGDRRVPSGGIRLKYDDGDAVTISPELVTVDGRAAPEDIGEGESALVQAVFFIPGDAELLHLTFEAGWTGLDGIKYQFD